MKIKAEITIAINDFENIKPVIDIEVPENLEGADLVKWLHKEYHHLCNNIVIQNDIIARIKLGRPIQVGEWEEHIAPYPQVAYMANEAKKNYKRSTEYKSTQIPRDNLLPPSK